MIPIFPRTNIGNQDLVSNVDFFFLSFLLFNQALPMPEGQELPMMKGKKKIQVRAEVRMLPLATTRILWEVIGCAESHRSPEIIPRLSLTS